MLLKFYTDDVTYKLVIQQKNYIKYLFDYCQDILLHNVNYDKEYIHSLEFAIRCSESVFFNTWGVQCDVFSAAEDLKNSGEWIQELCEFLCKEAGILNEYQKVGDDENYPDIGIENVMDHAAEILGVQIYQNL